MADVQGLLNDPDFNQLSLAKQKEALGSVDPQFANLSDQGYLSFRSQVKGGGQQQNTLNGAPAAKTASPEQRKLWDSMKDKGDPTFNAAIEKLSQPGDGESHLMRDMGGMLVSPITGLAGIPDAIRSWLQNPQVGNPHGDMAGDIFGNAMGVLGGLSQEVSPSQAASMPIRPQTPSAAAAPSSFVNPLSIVKPADILKAPAHPLRTLSDLGGRYLDAHLAAKAQVAEAQQAQASAALAAANRAANPPRAVPPPERPPVPDFQPQPANALPSGRVPGGIQNQTAIEPPAPNPMDRVDKIMGLSRFKKSPNLRSPKQAPEPSAPPQPGLYQQQMGAGARLPLPKPGSLAEQSAEAQAAAPPAAQQTGRLNGRGMIAPGAEAPPKAAAAQAPTGTFTDWFNKPAEAQDFIARNANFKVSPTQFGGKPGVPFRASRPPDTVAPKSIASIPATGAASWSQAMGLSPDMGLAMLKQAGWLITK